jgi:5-oxoprolinase (ATP-hydrolysing)
VSIGWEFWIDRGGTFTDCVARSPSGELRTVKLLSSDRAPVDCVRSVLEAEGEIEPGAALPPCSVKLGSTVATNALLERRGARTALVTHASLGDVFTIGTQQRPELFELAINRPPPVHTRVVGITGRVGVDGSEVEALDLDAARDALEEAREAGFESVAVVLAHAYAFPEMEARLLALAREVGIPFAVASHTVARELGLLARGETTAADAYLTPLLARHVDALSEALPGSQLRFMQSSGGLTDAARFRGPTALLSGPAGGVVAAVRVAGRAGFDRAIGFDMGGTSTDVSLIVDGEVERAFETLVGGIRVKSPMLRIHTVAAGGGSLCRFDGFRLTVGPESAGADPGPLCYGKRGEDGDAVASELAITDVNLFLGRLVPDRFPFELDPSPVAAALEGVRASLAAAGFERSLDEVAAGFVEIANASMAEAIQQVSVGRGVDPRDYVLVGFGGAGGQHVCAIARALSIRKILLHPLAGLLSAYGIGVAEPSWDGQRDAARVTVPEPGAPLPPELEAALAELESQGRAALDAEGVAPGDVRIERWLDLRYRGTDTALPVCDDGTGGGVAFDWSAHFTREHEQRFGYARKDRAIEITTVRIRARGPSPGAILQGPAESPAPAEVVPVRYVEAWFPGRGRTRAPIFRRESLVPGTSLQGPAILLEDTGTVVVDPDFSLGVDGDGVLVLSDESPERHPHADRSREDVADPVRLEVFGNHFMSIAEQMGAVLRNTSVSTNIKERLDYSCAVFDGSGGLVANAPHIPVHLGAMSETVRAVLAAFPDARSGDVFVTNDPFSGGSHLPDVTVVTPVFLASADEAPTFFVASRGHHADIGGTTPGSMPPASRSLEEEGVIIPPMRLVRDGVLDEPEVRRLLEGAVYPARQPADNLADLEAMVAANQAGVDLVRRFAADEGAGLVAATMSQLQAASAAKVAEEIGRLPDGRHRFEDRLDDGTPIRVSITVRGERMEIDFEGTGPALEQNLNAPRAIVQAAVIYVLRSLVAERIPLNGGCLDPVRVKVPPGCLLDPPEGCAVVGGNVETSQRVVDVLLGALGLAAASQGTMNNVTFGDETFGYYETIAGGSGAGPDWDGTSGVHTHMTNTRITDLEVLESRYPVRLREFSLRTGSGGRGRHRGGDGLVRRYEFLAPVVATLLTERRDVRPYGLEGGEPGQAGRNSVTRANGEEEQLPGKCSVSLGRGDVLTVETPGAGGYGSPRSPLS